MTRRFPDYGWAWPFGDLDMLIKAVLLPDDEAALRSGLMWLKTHDIDAVGFRDHRLLAALADRFGKRLSESPALPRLIGLQRLLWSRSRMALRDSRNALEALSRSKIPFMLIKGASHVAVNPSIARSRVSHDIDVLVRPQDMRDTFGILLDHGWIAANGAGHLRLKQRASTFRAMNFLKGEFGDIDLHQAAYHLSQTSNEDEDGLWKRSVAAELDGIPLRVPAPSDRIALAIGHSSFDAHAHSDWLVDIARTVTGEAVDWDDLISTLDKRRILVPAASALTYLVQSVGCPIPPREIERIVERADRRGLAERFLLLECKPKTSLGLLGSAARGVVKQTRLWKARRNSPRVPDTIWRARTVRSVARTPPAMGEKMGEKFAVPVSRAGPSILELTIQIEMPPARRRVELELTTGERYLALLRYRKLGKKAGLQELKFSGPVELRDEERQLFIQATTSRVSRYWKSPEDSNRYRPLPFLVQSAAMNPRSET